MMTSLNPNQHAIGRRREMAAQAEIVVTGWKTTASTTTTLYCDTEQEAQYLIDLMFRAGFLAAGWEPNTHKQ